MEWKGEEEGVGGRREDTEGSRGKVWREGMGGEGKAPHVPMLRRVGDGGEEWGEGAGGDEGGGERARGRGEGGGRRREGGDIRHEAARPTHTKTHDTHISQHIKTFHRTMSRHEYLSVKKGNAARYSIDKRGTLQLYKCP